MFDILDLIAIPAFSCVLGIYLGLLAMAIFLKGSTGQWP